MKKKLVKTTLVLSLGLSAFAAVPAGFGTDKVSAATVSVQNNQQAVDKKANDIIRFAKSLIGKANYGSNYSETYPYEFKCASFIEFIFRANGVHLGSKLEDYMVQQGTYVPKSQLQKGDLVFFKRSSATTPNHVAMYIGDNKVIHMANEELDVVISDLNSTDYYRENYMTARRVLPSLLPSNSPTQADNIVEDAYDLMDEVTMGRTNDEKNMEFSGGGYVNYIYKINGINLGKTTVTSLSKLGEKVSRNNLRKGDLIFFNSKVGSTTPTRVAIYAGEHRIIVPSSTGISDRVLLSDYYNSHYMYAKRVIE
jgi:cell wall-associated NlpC family hydrolase